MLRLLFLATAVLAQSAWLVATTNAPATAGERGVAVVEPEVRKEAVMAEPHAAKEEHGLPQAAVPVLNKLGRLPITNSMVVSWMVALGLIGFAQVAARKMQRVPTGAQNVWEWLGVGFIGMKASEAVGRNPGAATKILVQSILAIAFAEAIVFYALFLAKQRRILDAEPVGLCDSTQLMSMKLILEHLAGSFAGAIARETPPARIMREYRNCDLPSPNPSGDGAR